MGKQTWYRGEALGGPADSPGANIHDLKPGLYLTDRLDVAYSFAGTRSKGDDLPSVRYREFDTNALGRTLDLTAGPFQAKWEDFERQTNPANPTQTNRDLMKRGGGNYGRMFDLFLMVNKININDYDMVIGPEYLRGGNQLCILNKGGQRSRIASEIDVSMTVGKPMKPGDPAGGGGGAGGSGGRGGLGGAPLSSLNVAAAHIIIRNGLTQISLEKAGDEAMAAYLRKKPEIERLQNQYPADGVRISVYFQYQPGVNPDFNDNYRFEELTVTSLATGYQGIVAETLPRGQLQIFTGFLPALDPSKKPLQKAESPSDPLYQRYLQARSAVEPPAPYPYTECYNILNGSSMYGILRILNNLASDGFFNLLDNILPTIGGINTPRLEAAFGAVRASWGSGAVFANYKQSYSKKFFSLPEDQQKDIETFLTPKSKSAEVGSFLNGWWSVYDGNYYFYYFSPTNVVYTKTRPAPTAGAPSKPANRGTVKPGKDNTFIVTWNPLPGDSAPTVETFWLIWGQTRKMNAKSNKYGMIYAEKISPDKTD